MRRNLRRKIGELTFGFCTTFADLVLFTLFALTEIASSPGAARSMLKSQKILSKLFLERKDKMIRDALYRVKRKGWLEKDFKLTEEGKERLKSLLPKVLPKRKWGGKWYLIIFDIPEIIRKKRDVLRMTLKRLGCGQLQASVWISVQNYFGTIEEIVKELNLENYVIFAITDKLGKESSRALAERVWNLEKINLEYKELISQYKKANGEEKFWLTFKYYDTLKRDPQLPQELLPEDWQGEIAHLLFQKRPFAQ